MNVMIILGGGDGGHTAQHLPGGNIGSSHVGRRHKVTAQSERMRRQVTN